MNHSVDCLSTVSTLCVYGVEAGRRRRTTVPFPVGIPRRHVDRNRRRHLHDAVIPPYRRHLRACRRYFTYSGSKMAA